MGMPLAFVDAGGFDADDLQFLGERMQPDGLNAVGRSLQGARVIDLSALWAGPLCAHLLHQCGAEVTSVSSVQRPDGSQQGNPVLYQHLHAGQHLVLDFDDSAQRQQLAHLLASADVVIEASRPQALRQLGLIGNFKINNPQIWLSITAYGRRHLRISGRVLAICGGQCRSVARDDCGQPQFVGDAIADPLTGVYAALAVAESLAEGRSGLMDLSMVGIGRHCRQKILAAGRNVVCPLSAVSQC